MWGCRASREHNSALTRLTPDTIDVSCTRDFQDFLVPVSTAKSSIMKTCFSCMTRSEQFVVRFLQQMQPNLWSKNFRFYFTTLCCKMQQHLLCKTVQKISHSLLLRINYFKRFTATLQISLKTLARLICSLFGVCIGDRNLIRQQWTICSFSTT
jgi:hypothetical protein